MRFLVRFAFHITPLLVTLAAFTTEGYAQAFSAQPVSEQSLKDAASDLIQKHFPDLADAQIGFRSFESQDYFFQTDLNAFRLFGSKKKRKYWIEYNQNLLNQAPAWQAIRAVLVHELVHIRDYHRRMALEVLIWLARYGLGRVHIEKETDLETLRLGYSMGLMEYRYWLYAQLSDSELRKKKKIYLQPNEIQDWRNQNPQIPDLK